MLEVALQPEMIADLDELRKSLVTAGLSDEEMVSVFKSKLTERVLRGKISESVIADLGAGGEVVDIKRDARDAIHRALMNTPGVGKGRMPSGRGKWEPTQKASGEVEGEGSGDRLNPRDPTGPSAQVDELKKARQVADAANRRQARGNTRSAGLGWT